MAVNLSPNVLTRMSTKLIAMFLLLSIVPLAAVAYLAFNHGRRTISQTTIDHLTSTTILKEAELGRWVEDRKNSLRLLARESDILEQAAGPAFDEVVASETRAIRDSIREDQFQPVLEIEGDWLEIFLLRAVDGLIFVSTDEGREGMHQESPPYFVEGQDHTYFQNVYYSVILEEAAMTIATPVEDGMGDLVAVLAGRVNLVSMSSIMAQSRELYDTEETYLVNKFNLFVTEGRFEQGYTLKKAIHTEGVEACLEGNSGTGFYDDYRGIPVIGVYRWIAEQELCILTELDQAEAFAPIVTLRRAVLGIGAAVVLIVALLALFFARTITKPVRQLVKGVEEVGRGNLGYRIAMTKKNELGRLANAFDAMAAKRKHAEGALQQAHQKLSAQAHQLEGANVELSQYAYAVSHDIQTPLRAIHNYADFLEEDLADILVGEPRMYLDGLRRAVREAEELVQDLLALSRTGQHGVPSESIDIGLFIRELIASLDLPPEIEIVMAEEWPTLDIERVLLRQVYQNLIVNAVKFNQSSPKILELGWRAKGADAYELFVYDNGIGIAPRHHGQIFRVFQRLHSSKEYEGTGVGLAIVKKALNKLGGAVRVESTLGEGSKFFVTLPKSRESDSKEKK